MVTFLRAMLIALVIAITLTLTLWGTLALWFRAPGPDALRGLLAGAFGLLGAATTLAQFNRQRLRFLFGFMLAVTVVTLWWNTLVPPAQANWSPDVARQVTGQIENDTLTLTGVRNFSWDSPESFTENWETRNYDLNTLETVDLFMSYWSGPQIAHMVLSFGFAGDDYLAWSAEVRRRSDSLYSPVADMFKSHTLVLIAADERDVIGTRTNARGEDVQLYRIKTTPGAARALLEKYVETANELAETPRWYNSITTNCTTVVMTMIRTLFETVPLDWRIFVNGYLPEYAYERDLLDTRYSLAELRDRARITPRARAVGITPGYSTDIRQGIPSPMEK